MTTPGQVQDIHRYCPKCGEPRPSCVCEKAREMMLEAVAKYKLRRIFDMAKYEIKDIHKAIDRLLDERFDMAAQAKTLLGEITDDNGRTVQIQLCLEARPEMFMPMEPED